MTLVDLSHEIRAGMTTYPGIPPPAISTVMTFEESRDHYAAGTEFEITRLDLAANTGTYLDTPAHRHRGTTDLAGIDLERVADLPGVVVRGHGHDGRAIPARLLPDRDLSGWAVLFDTGWSSRWGSESYFSGHPYLAAETVAALVAAGPALVGIDSLNIDDTDDLARTAHTQLLGADILIIEHMTKLDELPDDGFRFFAVAPAVRGMGTFPVRAFASIG